MAFWGFKYGGLVFWAILLDLAGDCMDFAVACDRHKEACKHTIMQKKERSSKVQKLEQRSRELEAEIEVLKQQLAELMQKNNQ
ncbi:hypothetical protein HSX37_13315|uniref:Uncharacterized protein n=1 Tax=Dendrosporobacter quercicolus TaxID=146817 RepID=A0A1H0AU80_9FIRM|nr:hypothetical protein [Dendrosporobacter quercicolus]NSL49013.1 hypothetical protein [Dendrosporobacter quercicolus DSM 1736]SDN36895.1 hypothetical protein SAMN04488502_1235 [Dendrosporobacter quercicolus]